MEKKQKSIANFKQKLHYLSYFMTEQFRNVAHSYTHQMMITFRLFLHSKSFRNHSKLNERNALRSFDPLQYSSLKK